MSAQSFKLKKLGPSELLVVFEPDANGVVELVTPQSERKLENQAASFNAALGEFTTAWRQRLRTGTDGQPSFE